MPEYVRQRAVNLVGCRREVLAARYTLALSIPYFLQFLKYGAVASREQFTVEDLLKEIRLVVHCSGDSC
jgi:hypothetical protein